MKENRMRILLPKEVADGRLEGRLFGYFHPETQVVNILGCGSPPPRPAAFAPCRHLGWLGPLPQGAEPGDLNLKGRHGASGPEFLHQGKPCDLEIYALELDIFSRNAGILESSRLKDRTVLIVGCGSVGSLLALELARAGVGRFVLMDQDVLAYHNLCRHQCGITDVGRYKVEALRDRVLDINPTAQVHVEPKAVQRVEKEVFDRYCHPAGLIVGCGDNREADLYANRISCLYRIPLLAIGLWERAFAGEVFYSLPGETACYQCLVQGLGDTTGRISANRRLYTTLDDLSQVAFEPGISTDLSLVTLVGAKLAYDLLCRGDAGYVPRVLGALTQFTLCCNTVDPTAGGELTELFSHPFQVTRSIEVERWGECSHCRIVGAARGEAGK